MDTAERVRDLIAPIVERDGVELYDVEHTSGILRIMVDRPGGIDVDTIGELSQQISSLLDERDPLPDSKYLLEVTSPGIERKLRTPAHFARQIGREIAVKFRVSSEGARRLEGRLEDATDTAITVAHLVDAEESSTTINYDDIESARVVYRWEDELSPGNAKKKTNNKKVSAR